MHLNSYSIAFHYLNYRPKTLVRSLIHCPLKYVFLHGNLRAYYVTMALLLFVIMAKEGQTKSVNFMTPMVGVVVLDGDHIGDKAKMLYFIEIVYSTLRV